MKICAWLGCGEMLLEPQPCGPLAFGPGVPAGPLLWLGVAAARAGQPCAKNQFATPCKKCMSQLVMHKINILQLAGPRHELFDHLRHHKHEG